MKKFRQILILSWVIFTVTQIPSVQAENEVNVYSYRQPFLIKPMFAAFTRDTNIKINTVFAKKVWWSDCAKKGSTVRLI